MDGFAESTKRKAAVWPLQIILLILCPEIIQDISKDVVDENNINKVRAEWVSDISWWEAVVSLNEYILVRAVLGPGVVGLSRDMFTGYFIW